jgi:hypothetical protein
MKVTKIKVSIHCLARQSGVMIDTLLKTGWYCSKAHASCAILQASRTARLQVAHCQHKSSNSKIRNDLTINPSFPSLVPPFLG